MAGLGRKVWAADEILAAADLQDYIQDQTVMRFATAAARTSGILSPTEGMVTYLDSENALFVFDGSSWVAVVADGSITNSKIADLAVTDSKIVSMQAVKLSGLTANHIVVTNSVGQVVSLSQIQTSQVSGYGTGTWTGTVSAGGNAVSGGNASFSGSGSFAGSISAVGGFSGGSINVGGNAVTCGNFVNSGTITSPASRNTISGSWNVLYIDANGVLGIPPSTARLKQDIVSADIDIDDVLELELVNFRYKADVESLGDDAPVQIGLIAEQVEQTIGPDFVFYDDDGLVGGVHYERLALALLPALQQQQQQINDLNARLSKIEGK